LELVNDKEDLALIEEIEDFASENMAKLLSIVLDGPEAFAASSSLSLLVFEAVRHFQ
jgi:hypothetical protein